MQTRTSDRYRYSPPQEAGIDISPGDMKPYIARFADLVEDKEIFPDIKTAPIGDRQHFHVISPNAHLGPSGITTPHQFHMSFLKVPPGHGARLHAHRLPEVFTVLRGRFAILWGNQAQHHVELGEFDTISVPNNVMRTFRNIGDEEGLLQVIYDGGGEVLGEIFVQPADQDHEVQP
ncbi:MAG: cupin domain-containing protein [Burkholderiales bacterium]|nr:cupin domain-containing protein [Burkholderiales bacterium]ODU61994.1 MAG: hypothetical protein ABT05_08380 [Lautropia sp. SCN 66-9]